LAAIRGYLRGTVAQVPADSLPNDGKAIEDRRPID